MRNALLNMPESKTREPGYTASAGVESSQQSSHRRLPEYVQRHMNSHWQSPPHAATVLAFDRLQGLLQPGEFQHLVLDSGCGTGFSTRCLAGMHPDCVVIGVDKSSARLARTGSHELPHREGNCIWVRGELASFWRLARESGWHLFKHFLLYPNPWPRPGHLKRRWHGHPVFPTLMALGGEIEMRSNWEIYAQEFAMAAGLVTGLDIQVERLAVEQPLSPFEKKYLSSGHALFSVRFAVDKMSPGCPGLNTATKVHSS
jgi:tRNA G46 methylase TrmB